ncbi:MAG TPA: ABC transporter ATP-binding protein [Anaerolineaceae bacterium]|jgi:ATP-binding cassette, subfamily B, bacterial
MAASITEFSLPQRFKTNRKGPIRWIYSHALHHWPIAAIALVGAFSNAALAVVSPIFIGLAFNAILASPPQVSMLAPYALILAGSQVLRGFLQFFRNFGFELIAQRIERDVRDELYTNLLGKSMTFHSLQMVGDTMARATNDVREVNFLFSPGLNMVVGSLNFLVVPLFVAPTYHPSLILAPLLFVIFYFFALRAYLHTLSPVTDEVRQSFGQLNTRLAEALDGIETVKGSAREKSEIGRFFANAQRYRNAMVHQGNIEARFLPMLLLSVTYAFGLFHALLLYQLGVLNVGQVIAYFGILLMLDFPTFTSLFAYSRISLGLAGARRILELLNRENNLDQNLAGYKGPMKGEIEFRNVSFSYPDGEIVLDGISFKVKPGDTVAIVGQTGAGKTTLVKLINRTYDVTGGVVFVDGVDVRDWNLEALRKGISIIEQDIFLFSRSVGDNIAFGQPDAKEEAIKDAANAAQADEFISSLAEGYETVIGDRGVTLSGGQRQRLALARAFLTDPRVLILDDSTSAIDSATEDKIQRAIYAAAAGRTTFIITHRLSQIRWADLILVLRKGKLAAMGNHDSLMQKSEAYRRIFSG